jgi:hypothetical protein
MKKSTGTVLTVIVLSALAIMAHQVRAASSPKPPKPEASPAKGVAAPQGIIPFNVRLHGHDCDHDVSPARASFHTATNDKLRWHVQNSCRSDQQILFCVYDGPTRLLKNPFAPCLPGAGISYDIGKPFTVAAHGQTTFDCVARDHGQFTKQVRVGSEVPPAGCPPSLETTPAHHGGKKDVHALDIEINP